MDWVVRLLSVSVLAGLLVAVFLSDIVQALPIARCDTGDIYTSCPRDSAEISPQGQGVDLRRTQTSRLKVDYATGGAADSELRKSRVLTADEIQALWDEQCYGSGHCSTGSSNGLNNLLLPRDPVEPADAAAPARTVTIEDVERFVPSTAQLRTEPDGWAVVGVPANFWTVVEPVVVDGELLGESAQVRFAPQLYRWDYGDGETRTTRSGGASWSGLGQQELTGTTTSHLYLQKADVDASVTVIWSAEYRIASGPWTAVAGAVSSSTPDVDLLVVKERTVLTAR